MSNITHQLKLELEIIRLESKILKNKIYNFEESLQDYKFIKKDNLENYKVDDIFKMFHKYDYIIYNHIEKLYLNNNSKFEYNNNYYYYKYDIKYFNTEHYADIKKIKDIKIINDLNNDLTNDIKKIFNFFIYILII